MPIGSTTVTIVGNLCADPELTHTTAGVPRAAFTVASTTRVYDKPSGEWRDGDTLFLRCSAWRTLAENVTASLTKGSRVVVTGTLRQFEMQTADGMRTGYGLDIEDIGASLKHATADIHRTTRSATAGAGAGAMDKPPF
ncbi:single-stranded DNA-binding protein [Embleya sp. NPDC050154]|uniref:single-stranded DNA-binding protein n=1 Tax=Embleya sp. NPDC050154 TaxID=3363988 RepID=UPI0037AC62BA